MMYHACGTTVKIKFCTTKKGATVYVCKLTTVNLSTTGLENMLEVVQWAGLTKIVSISNSCHVTHSMVLMYYATIDATQEQSIRRKWQGDQI